MKQKPTKIAVSVINGIMATVSPPLVPGDSNVDHLEPTPCSAASQLEELECAGEIDETRSPAASGETCIPAAFSVFDESGNPRAPDTPNSFDNTTSSDLLAETDMSIFDAFVNNPEECEYFANQLKQELLYKLFPVLEDKLEQYKMELEEKMKQSELEQKQLLEEKLDQYALEQERLLEEKMKQSELEQKRLLEKAIQDLKLEIKKDTKGFEMVSRYTNIARIIIDICKIWIDIHKP